MCNDVHLVFLFHFEKPPLDGTKLLSFGTIILFQKYFLIISTDNVYAAPIKTVRLLFWLLLRRISQIT